MDGNGVVDGLDLTAVLTAWETRPGDPLWNALADLDGNGVVNGLDLTEVISNWTTETAAAPPAALGTAPTETTEDTTQAGSGEGVSHPGNVRTDGSNVRTK